MHLTCAPDQVYTHMIDVMSEITIIHHSNVQRFNFTTTFVLHSDGRLEGL
jgi:hypothetical protein